MHRPTFAQRIGGGIRDAFILAAPTAFVLLIIFAVASCVGSMPGQYNLGCPVIDWVSYRNWIIAAAGLGFVVGFLHPKIR